MKKSWNSDVVLRSSRQGKLFFSCIGMDGITDEDASRNVLEVEVFSWVELIS